MRRSAERSERRPHPRRSAGGSAEPRRVRRRPGPPSPSRDHRGGPSSELVRRGPPEGGPRLVPGELGRVDPSGREQRPTTEAACRARVLAPRGAAGRPARRRGDVQGIGTVEPATSPEEEPSSALASRSHPEGRFPATPRRECPGCSPERAPWQLPERSSLDAPEGSLPEHGHPPKRDAMTDHRSRPSPWCAPPRGEAATTWRESRRACASCRSRMSRSSVSGAGSREPPEGSAVDRHRRRAAEAAWRVGLFRPPEEGRRPPTSEACSSEGASRVLCRRNGEVPLSLRRVRSIGRRAPSCLGASPEDGRIDSPTPSPTGQRRDTEASWRGLVGRGGGTSSVTSARADGGAYELGNRVSSSSSWASSRGRWHTARRETLCD